MKTIKPNILPLAAALFLAGCGGGSDSGPTFEGVYTGSYTNGDRLTNIVLEDGSLWALYGAPSGSGTDFEGFSKGKVDSKDGKFTASFTNFEQPGNDVSSGIGTGTYTSSSAAGTVTIEGTTLNFNVTKLPFKNYVYDKDADLSTVAGTWSGKLLDGENGTFNILADGIFSGDSNGCQFNGKFEPRPSGVNVFNVTLNFGGAPCAFPNQTATGVALTTLRNDGKSELLVVGTLPTLQAGSLFSAAR